MRALLQFLLIFVGYTVACFAAGLLITDRASDLLLEPSTVEQGSILAELLAEIGAFGGSLFLVVAAVTTLIIGAFAFVPSLIAIVICEMFRIRSVIAYLLFGGALGFVGGQIGAVYTQESAQQALILSSAAGFIGGFTYWLIAGRHAGIWHESRNITAPPSEEA